jgi:hypothetical protein
MTKDQLKRRIQDLARQVYSATTVTPEEAIEYLLNLPEEERATQSIANMLRYGIKEEEGSSDLAITPEEPPAETPPIEEPAAEEPST